MGMAASQARLLTLTARIHDVEYAAQSIQNAKIQLSTQSDQVYQDYLEALDATTLTVKDWEGNRIAANFNNLCGMNRVDSMYTYSLYDEKGRLILPNDIYNGYKNFKNYVGTSGGSFVDDAYAFAMYMLDPDNVDNVYAFYANEEEQMSAFAKTANENSKTYQQAMDNILNNPENYEDYDFEKYGADRNHLKDNKNDEYTQLEEKRNYQIYRSSAETLYTKKMGGTDFDMDEFNKYVNYFKQIQEAGDCVSISEFNGISGMGDASSDGDWLQKMIQSGKITIDTWQIDTKTGALNLKATGVSSDTCLEYTTTSTIDKSALAKAEAEYEYKTKQIDKKDKQYDNELSKLETERTALTKEYESVQKVISENIERTFGIFS